MSAPDPATVKVRAANPAMTGTPTAPIPWLAHGEGRGPGVAATPVPLILPVSRLEAALLCTTNVAELAIAAVGRKTRSTVHIAPGATVRPVQPSVAIANCEGLLPASETAAMVSGADPASVTVIVRGALLVPTLRWPKSSAAGEMPTARAA